MNSPWRHRVTLARLPRKLRPVPGANDALNEYISHTGSALFALPPRAREGGYVGEGLFESI